MKLLIRCVLAGAAALAAVAAQAATVIAFVADVQGEVTVGGKGKAGLMTELSNGQRLTLGADARMAVMYLQSGRELRLQGPGEYAVGEADIATVSGAPPAARDTARKPNPQVVASATRSAAASTRMRELSFVPGPQYPRRGSIASPQPLLRWKFEAQDAPEQLTITLLDEWQAKIAEASVPRSGQWQAPAPLDAGKRYFWILSAEGRTLGEASFRLLPPDAMAQADQRRPADNADFSDWVMFALQLREMGADEESREVWGRLARQRPDSQELARLAR